MAEIANRLREGREAAATGVLTLDREKAHEKLRRYRLPDPHLYVLQFVRAASVLGATKIEFTVTPSFTVCEFDRRLPPAALEDVWRAAFEERATREQAAVHNFALGVVSAQALNPMMIEVISGSKRLMLRGDEEEIDDVTETQHTKITVMEKFRLGHITEFLTSIFGVLPEVAALRSHCAHSLIDVTANDEPVNTVLRTPGLALTEQADEATLHVLVTSKFARTDLVLLRDDVQVHQQSVEPYLIGGLAVMNDPQAPTDLSGLRLRHVPEQFPGELLGLYHRVVHRWASQEEFVGLAKRDLRGQLYRLSLEVASRSEADPAPAGTRELFEWLLEQPIFTRGVAGSGESGISVYGAMVHGVIRYVTEVIVLPDGPQDVMLVETPAAMNAMARAGYPVRDITPDLAAEVRRYRNKARWLAQPTRAPHVGSTSEALDFHGAAVGRYLISTSQQVVRIGDLQAMVETCATNAYAPGIVQIYVDGRLVRENASVLPFQIALYGGFKPGDFYDDVERDARFDELALAVLDLVKSLVALTTGGRERSLDVLVRLATGTFDAEVLAALGYDSQHAERLLESADRPRDVSLPDLLRIAGPLADGPMFDRLVGGPCSVAAVIEAAEPPCFAVWGDLVLTQYYETEMGPARRRELPSRMHRQGRLVLTVSELERRLVQAIRSDAVDLDNQERSDRAVVRFLAQPKFTDYEDEGLLREVIEGADFVLDMRLMDETRSQTIVDLVWRERLLATQRWKTDRERPSGVWHVTVRSEQLRPTDLYDDVLEDNYLKYIRASFDQHATRILGTWRAGEPARPSRDMTEHKRAYMTRAPLPPSLADALFAWRGDVDGFDVHTAIFVSDYPRHRVDVVWQGRVLEELSNPCVIRCHTILAHGSIEADDEWRRIERGRDDALRAAKRGLGELIEKGCLLLAERRGEALPARLELVRAQLANVLVHSIDEVEDTTREALETAPLLDTRDGRGESLRERERRRQPAADDLLEVVCQHLRSARGERRELLTDFILATFCWAEDGQEELCRADRAGVSVRRDHPVVAAVADAEPVATAFLASCITTQINAYYRQITDTDELTLQRALLRRSLD